MAARGRKPGSGSLLLGLAIFSISAVAAWFLWPEKKGQLTQLPDLIDSLKQFAGSTNTAQPQTNQPPRTNIIASIPRSTFQPDIKSQPIQPAQPAATKTQTNPVPSPSEPEPTGSHPVKNVLEAQIALARLGISVGCIDGVMGENMRRALLAWQIHNRLPVSGELDTDSKNALTVEEPLLISYTVTEDDLGRIMKIPATWVGKSEQKRLDYESILELIAERGRATTGFIKKQNPQINWTNVPPGTLVRIPRIDPPPREKAAFARVHLYSKTIDVFGKSTNLIAHFPCSIAAKVEKRPIGALFVAKAAANPSYLFDPAVFTESEEAKKIDHKLTIPPGPNNPVGTAWIGLDRPGYGIHGTPKPEQIGRTESHGCFRLANWNADHLLQLAWAGMPVIVEP